MTEHQVPASFFLPRTFVNLCAWLVLGASCTIAFAQGPNLSAADAIGRGEYLARAGDCIACHTKPGDKLFAGGRAMPTPFGTLYSPNITPDKETGIGQWSADEFYSMMHTGRSRDGA